MSRTPVNPGLKHRKNNHEGLTCQWKISAVAHYLRDCKLKGKVSRERRASRPPGHLAEQLIPRPER